jgi:ATP-dependent RNA helicase DeaD
VPYHRRGSAARLLKLAKLEAISQAAPGPAEIDQRNRERILADPALAEAPGEDEADFVREILTAYSPEQIAAAYLRQQLAARPAAEELSEGPPPVFDPSKGERPDARFTNGVWFSISVGRKHRAEPRWLLPLICKAGHVTKREIGSIRILDTESRFEIVADRANGFAAAIREHGTGEKGVVIQRIEGGGKVEEPAGSWTKKAHRKGPSAYAPKPRPDSAPGERPKKNFKPKKRPAKT